MELYDKDTGEVLGDVGGYVRCHADKVPLVFNGVANLLFILLRNMRYNSERVYINERVKMMCEEAGIGRSALYRHLQTLEKSGIVTRGRECVYIGGMFTKGSRYKYNPKWKKKSDGTDNSEQTETTEEGTIN